MEPGVFICITAGRLLNCAPTSPVKGNHVRRFAAYQLPLILYAALVLTVSSISGLPTPDLGIDFLDKLAHFCEYFIFLVLMFRALANPPFSLSGFTGYLLAVILSIVFAGFDEYYQSHIPGRESDIYDLVADSMGIILGAFLVFLFFKRRRIAP